MCDGRAGDVRHVVRHDEPAPPHCGRRPGGFEEVLAPARGDADGDALVGARLLDDVDDVLLDLVVDADRLRDPLHHEDAPLREDRRDGRRLFLPSVASVEQRQLRLLVGIAQAVLDQEAVLLRLRERERLLALFDAVLRGDDEERVGKRVRLAVDRHLPLGHRLEERGLRLRRGTGDPVGEDDVREHRPLAELGRPVALAADVRPGHVGGKEVGRELDPREREAKRGREPPCGQRLSAPRHALEEHVSPREHAREDPSEHVAVHDDGPRDLVEDARTLRL